MIKAQWQLSTAGLVVAKEFGSGLACNMHRLKTRSSLFSVVDDFIGCYCLTVSDADEPSPLQGKSQMLWYC